MQMATFHPACGQHYDRVVARSLCVGCALLAALAVGCSRSSGADSPPKACTDGPAPERVAALRSALAHAPSPVRLPDGTSIADCLAHDSGSGDLENVGSMLLTATQQIEDSAAGPGDRAALLQLGYLAGAVHRGATGAQVDGEIERRIDQEMGAFNTASPAFTRGEQAGRANG
jgi:hypothetical protein